MEKTLMSSILLQNLYNDENNSSNTDRLELKMMQELRKSLASPYDATILLLDLYPRKLGMCIHTKFEHECSKQHGL